MEKAPLYKEIVSTDPSNFWRVTYVFFVCLQLKFACLVGMEWTGIITRCCGIMLWYE